MKIVTDSTADIPKALVEGYGINIVPLTVKLGDKIYRDYYDLSPSEFFQLLKNTTDFPNTSQPSVEEFLNTYKKLGNEEDIISIHISMELSATCQSAGVAAKQLPEQEITIIDSRLTSAGLGLLVLEAAKAIRSGANKAEVMALIEQLKTEIKIYFSVDSLDYLQKGGRIGKAQAFLGSMLKIKPLLFLSDGMVAPVERIRGTKKLISRMAEIVQNDAGSDKIVKAGFIWGDEEGNITKLISLLNDSVQIEEIYRSNIGTVITSHTGPTTFGVAYFCSEKV